MFLATIALALASTALAQTADVGDITLDVGSNTKDVGCNANTIPTQIRIAYHGDSGMAVSWNTKQQLTKPTVWYGYGKTQPHSATSDISTTYQTSTTYNNHVIITGLESDHTYNYRPNCGTTVYSFTTARPIGKKTEYSFAMIGDMGTMGPDGLSTTVGTGAANPLAPGEKNTIDSLTSLQSEYDFVWHVGDIAYADAWLKEETGGYIKPLNESDNGAEYDKILNEFFNETEPLTSVKPYMVLPGNHEANCDNGKTLSICLPGQLNFTGYRHHWNMPSQVSGGFESMWYSFNHGMVHFVSISTETDFLNAPDQPGGEGAEDAGPFQPSGTQLAWLKADLAAVNRKKTPWVLVGAHRPWYVSSTVCVECQAAFEPIFDEYEVDVVVHGHVHFYERQTAIFNGTGQSITNGAATGPWYIVNGAAGHYDGLDVPTLPAISTSQELIATTYGWNLFTAHNCTHLTTSFIASNNNSVLDTATLYKDRKCNLDG